jgi:Ca2+-binding RTX toxin-like protein
MVENTSSTPASGGNTTFTGTSGADQISGGGGNDSISGGAGNDTLSGDGPLPGQWQYSVYNYNFGSGSNQAPLITSGTLVGQGYVDDFDVGTLTNTVRGTTGDPNDMGLIYRSTLNVTTGGTYRLTTTSDDGSRVIIRDSSGNILNFANQTGGTLPYLNNDFHQSPATRYGDVVLQSGQTYSIEVLYWENQGGNVLSATISGPDTGNASTNLVTSPMLGVPPVTGQPDGNDTIDGGDGNDTIYGGGGNDRLLGGTGNDTVFGGTGADSISGGSGADTLFGGTGNDSIDGGTGNDIIDAGADNDTISGGAGSDTITTGTGADFITGASWGGGVGVIDTVTDFDPSLDIADLSGQFATLTAMRNATTIVAGNAYVTLPDGSIVIFNGITDPAQLTNGNTLVPCFTPGAMIDTPHGPRAVETLRRGDLVLTEDAGPQPLAWIGDVTVSAERLAQSPNLRPVLIPKGSLGNGLPDADLLLSPQHRVLISGWRVQMYSDAADGLASARHLAAAAKLPAPQTIGPVRYIHLMFDSHQIIRANGLPTESLQPGLAAVSGFAPKAREELFALFPDLRAAPRHGIFPLARPVLRRTEVGCVLGA